MNLLNFEGKDFGPNFYELLGCDQNSSSEQISTEFKIRALKVHPDKNLENKMASDQFKELQQAKETLTDPFQRQEYDTWLNSGMMMSWKDWSNFTSKSQTVFHWTIKKDDLMIKSSETNYKTKSSNQSNSITNNGTFNQNDDDILRKFRNYEI